MSSVAPVVVPVITGSSGNDAGNLDLWMQALNTLSVEDRKQFDNPSSSMLDVLNSVCIVSSARRAYSASVTTESYLLSADCASSTRFKKPQKAIRKIVSQGAGECTATRMVKRSSFDTSLRRSLYGSKRSSRSSTSEFRWTRVATPLCPGQS